MAHFPPISSGAAEASHLSRKKLQGRERKELRNAPPLPSDRIQGSPQLAPSSSPIFGGNSTLVARKGAGDGDDGSDGSGVRGGGSYPGGIYGNHGRGSQSGESTIDVPSMDGTLVLAAVVAYVTGTTHLMRNIFK